MNVTHVNLQQTSRVADAMQSLNQIREPNATGESSSVFSMMLDAYTSMVNTAGALEANAQNLSIDFAIGRHDDMLAVILAQEQAYSSMFFTVQVTSRIIEAYREIMRMQI